MNILTEKNQLEKVLMSMRPEYYDFKASTPFVTQRNIVIAGFPGVGKSFCEKAYPANCYDLDYHWSTKYLSKEVNIDWPGNYIEYIHQVSFRNHFAKTYILTSTHKEVLTGLRERGIDFIIVAPYDKYKTLLRYERKRSPKNFIDSINANWDTYMRDIESYGVPTFYTDMYLSELICGGKEFCL